MLPRQRKLWVGLDCPLQELCRGLELSLHVPAVSEVAQEVRVPRLNCHGLFKERRGFVEAFHEHAAGWGRRESEGEAPCRCAAHSLDVSKVGEGVGLVVVRGCDGWWGGGKVQGKAGPGLLTVVSFELQENRLQRFPSEPVVRLLAALEGALKPRNGLIEVLGLEVHSTQPVVGLAELGIDLKRCGDGRGAVCEGGAASGRGAATHL